MTSYRTDRSRAQGLGSAHHGAGTWIKERVSSIILVPLTLWGLWSAALLSGSGFRGAVDWMQVPLNAVLLLLTVGVSLYHMQLGMRVIVEDYIHKPFSKAGLLIINFVVCLALGVAAAFSILKVAFGGFGA
jgi:succinate dehydrogenase / fumarate reductase membrane anchor subunit